MPRWKGSASVDTSSGLSVSPVFSTQSVAPAASALVATQTVPSRCRLWTIALCTRFVPICSSRACEPMAGVTSPEVSMVSPRSSARGRSVSVASSAIRDRSTRSRMKARRSARLSRRSASVRSIARALTACRRSTSSPVSRPGSLRATSRSVWVIARGVRSSWDALAANLRCSATCASSRASIVSKASASSRNSSVRPSSRIRWESDPPAAMRVASVMRVSGASMRPARSQPPTSPNTSRNAMTAAALGANSCRRLDRTGKTPGVRLLSASMSFARSGTYRRRNSQTAARSRVPATMRNPA